MLFLRTRFFVMFMALIIIVLAGGAALGYRALTTDGDKAGAEAAVKKALELQPDNHQAQRLLKQLGQ